MASEPQGRPVESGMRRSTPRDIDYALTKARRYLYANGGEWTPTLREYVDAWLDYKLQRQRESAKPPVASVP